MSETPFVRTGYAKTLFESQIPALLEVLREISASLKVLAEAAAKAADSKKLPS